MLNYVNGADVEGNVVRDGGEKCLFMYNANKNELRNNVFEGCPIGIHFTAGSERNSIAGNAFMGNRTQVKYVGTSMQEWSADGRGNYWSDFAGFDMNADGIADQAYRPNDMIDQVLWTQPAAALLLGSPAVQLIRWAQREFPGLLPGGVVDSGAADGAAAARPGCGVVTALLALSGVTKRFGSVGALTGLTLAVEPGERVALLGHNGAGKTTLLRLVLGFIRPDAGSIRIAGNAPDSVAARRIVAYLPENVAFPKALTGAELIGFYARLKGAARADAMAAL